jgi:hypothetical protein
MGSGYSIVDGNVEISKERMKQIYAKYSDPSAYDVWKKQLEEGGRQQELYYESKKKNATTSCVRNPEGV